MDDVDSEIATMKERLVRIETILESVQRTVDKSPPTGNIVIPVAAVVAVLEVVKAVLERVM